ncbi:MAG: iron-containing redox enzyme family protein [Sedimenticola sp.]
MGFRDELIRAASSRPMHQCKLIRILASGRAPRSLLQGYAKQLYAGAFQFPLQLIKLLRITPSETAKFRLMENIMEESGAVMDINHGLRIFEQNRHTSWAERFVVATGMSRSDCDEAVNNYRLEGFERRIDEGDWLPAMAYLLVGIEGNIPQTYETVVDGLLKSGFDREEIIFFSGHIVADAEHGEIGVNMIDEMTPSDKRQDVLDAVTEAADHWWNLHHQGAS